MRSRRFTAAITHLTMHKMVAIEPLCLKESFHRFHMLKLSVWAGLPLPFSSETLRCECAGTGHVDTVTPFSYVVGGSAVI